MPFLEEIANEIVAAGIDQFPQNGGGLLANQFLEGAGDAVTVLFENAAGPGIRVQDAPGQKYVEQIVQVSCRDTDVAARARALAIYNLFNGRGSEYLGETWYVSIDPLQAPFLLQRDENDRFTWAVNLSAVKRIS